jgi:arylsulfatase
VGHVIDLMSTILDVAGVRYPRQYQGREILPEEGTSLRATFEGRSVERRALCWEHEGNRAVRLGDWKLVAGHGERWQLYDMARDRTELHDVGAAHPEKVAELAGIYEKWAERCDVEPWPIRKLPAR